MRGKRALNSPDVVGQTSIRVHSADPADSAGRRAVLRHIHVISRPGKPRRLICIQHRHSDGGPVFDGDSAQEAGVHDGVEYLHREGVGAPALIVYSLERRTERSEPVGLKTLSVEVHNHSEFKYTLTVK